jgi:FAD/FMN-containing dehydrogenase
MPTRRKAIGAVAQAAAGLALLPFAPRRAESSVLVNDIHSQLNPTRVERVVAIESEATLRVALAAARAEDKPVCVAGGRHAMGGQQFAGDAVLLDMRAMRRIVGLDAEQGVVEAEAGIQWPELIERLIAMQQGKPAAWGIIQKQTGADGLTLGGALGANIHGRGLALKPIIGDVESFTLMHADGSLSTCSRSENRELFSLAIGGYGLFGVVTRVRLRLRRRTKLERVVRIIYIDDLLPAFAQRIGEGYLYGDCQFSTDVSSDTYLRKGVFACYRPPAADARRAYDAYTSYYLSTSGQRYWSDLGQLSVYIDDYHADLDRRLGSPQKGSEMITELYVPRPALSAFLAAVRADFRRHDVGLIYGTIRLIERDDESVLAWAREPWVCTVMNLHVDHTPERIAKAADDFRRLIDRAIEFGGSYFLTYHRWASRSQVEACHPHMVEFLRAKLRHDPGEAFQSDWYRHYKRMFADQL